MIIQYFKQLQNNVKPDPKNDKAIGSEQYGISSLSTSNPQQGQVSTKSYLIINYLFMFQLDLYSSLLLSFLIKHAFWLYPNYKASKEGYNDLHDDYFQNDFDHVKYHDAQHFDYQYYDVRETNHFEKIDENFYLQVPY